MYLIGSRFKLVTDSRAVQLIFNNTANRPPARIERWALRLTQFDFEIEHMPGNQNVADYFSRHPSGKPDNSSSEERGEKYINMIAKLARPNAIMMKEIIAATAADEELQALATWLSKKDVRFPSHLSGYSQARRWTES